MPEPGNPQALNRYAYAHNSPLNFIDPSGHQLRPPASCGAICYTGTFGPYNLESVAFHPNLQPLTVATIEPDTTPGDAGVLLWYWRPFSVQGRQELVIIHGEASIGPMAGSGEYRMVSKTPLLGPGKAEMYDEWEVSGGPSAQVPVLGGVSGRVAYSSKEGIGVSAEGQVLGGELSLHPHGVKFGYVPDVGSGGRIGLDWQGDNGYFIVTSYGYLRRVGLETINEQYAPPGTVLREMDIVPGRGRWSGLDLLCFKMERIWRLPYKEVP